MNAVRSTFFRRFLILAMLVSLSPALPSAYGTDNPSKYEHNRERLLVHVVRQYLGSYHFSHKEIDDNFSKAAFSLFLKQLDVQKRFLLEEDVNKLKAHSKLIDDEINTSKIDLPEIGADILSGRVSQASQIVKDILSRDFDFSLEESVETDPDKIDFCKTKEELKERWRKILKLQVLNQYLNLMEEKPSQPENSANTAEKKKGRAVDLQGSAREKILKSYDAIFSRMLQEKERDYFERYLGAVARSFDPHTEYMPPVNKEDFDISMRGSLEGIGATLKEEDSYIKVVSIVAGGPAFRQGQLHAEDIILKVGEAAGEPVDVTYMSVRDAVKLIRGKKGTEVRLTVKKPDGTIHNIPIVREIVQLEDTFAKGTTVKDEASGRSFGYIKIPSFYRDFEKTRNGGSGRNSTDDVRNELKKFESGNISGLILDLRNNGGGALTDAVKIAGLFIKTGPIVQVKSSDGKISVLSDDDPAINYKGPVIILVNKFSASASEILAGALQDYGRAVIMGGEHTHGKGTVQSMIDLNEDARFQNMEKMKPLGALKLTIQKFYRISGGSTQYRGVMPDILVPDVLRSLKSGEEFLDYALPWDTVTSAEFGKWSQCRINIPDLAAKSSSRVASKKDFMDIDAETNKAIERQKNTVRSLDINTFRKDWEESRKLGEKSKKGPHGLKDADKKPAAADLSEKEKAELWIKEVNEDAYVKEAVSVIEDLITADPSCVPMN